MRFQEKICIVTGGGQGIGKAVAQGLAREGAFVVIGDIDEESASGVAREIQRSSGDRAHGMKVDVKERADIGKMVEFAMTRFGRIDILFNNAGVCYLTKIQDITEREWNDVLGINLTSVFLFCQAVTPHLKEQRQGRIVNMASIAGKIGGISSGAHYAASKAGVICLTKVFARELAPYGVTVNAIAPGPVDTPMTQAFPPEVRDNLARTCPLGRLADTDDIAEAALFLFSDAAKHITGEILDVNGGLLMD